MTEYVCPKCPGNGRFYVWETDKIVMLADGTFEERLYPEEGEAVVRCLMCDTIADQHIIPEG